MKVKFTKQAKTYITVAEAEEARKIIVDMKEDEFSESDYLEIAARLACGGYNVDRVLEADAEICRNNNAWNNYSDNSGKLDVWVKGLAKVDIDTYMEVGANLTDIWMIGANRETDLDIKSRMYIETYKRTR